MVGIGYWDGGEIGNWDWELGLGIGTGDWGLVVTFDCDFWLVFGIGIWIGDWDCGLGLGIEIGDGDWRFGL